MRSRTVRTICVMLLAMAIAVLPLSMGFAVAAPAQASAAATMTQAMPDCDHHQHGAPTTDTQKSLDHGTCITGCALCFGLVEASATDVAYQMTAFAALTPAYVADSVSSLMGSPPFRPPRA